MSEDVSCPRPCPPCSPQNAQLRNPRRTLVELELRRTGVNARVKCSPERRRGAVASSRWVRDSVGGIDEPMCCWELVKRCSSLRAASVILFILFFDRLRPVVCSSIVFVLLSFAFGAHRFDLRRVLLFRASLLLVKRWRTGFWHYDRANRSAWRCGGTSTVSRCVLRFLAAAARSWALSVIALRALFPCPYAALRPCGGVFARNWVREPQRWVTNFTSQAPKSRQRTASSLASRRFQGLPTKLDRGLLIRYVSSCRNQLVLRVNIGACHFS